MSDNMSSLQTSYSSTGLSRNICHGIRVNGSTAHSFILICSLLLIVADLNSFKHLVKLSFNLIDMADDIRANLLALNSDS